MRGNKVKTPKRTTTGTEEEEDDGDEIKSVSVCSDSCNSYFWFVF